MKTMSKRPTIRDVAAEAGKLNDFLTKNIKAGVNDL